MDMDMRFLNQLAGVHPFMLENFNLTNFPSQNLLTHNYTEFPASSTHILQSNHFLTGDACHESNKRKVMVQSNSCSQITSTSSSTVGNGLEISYDTKRKKRKGNSENEVDNSEEVIHVRARRGQATDSHSLAERVRRQKISSKLKHLQDIVPGCYKSMGMAVMLDEIINYVYSLQSQVEFLSMELASSTSSYDFNQEIDAIIRRAST